MAQKRRRITGCGGGSVGIAAATTTGAADQERVLGMIGKTVFVPSSHFGVEVPDMYYR